MWRKKREEAKKTGEKDENKANNSKVLFVGPGPRQCRNATKRRPQAR